MKNENIDARGIFEEEIIKKLINDSSYFSLVSSYIKPNHFQKEGNSIILETILNLFSELNKIPNYREIATQIKDLPKNKKEVGINSLKEILSSKDVNLDENLLKSKTEEFIKKAIHTESLLLGAEGMGSNDFDKINKSYELAEEAMKFSLDDDFGTFISDLDKNLEYYQDDSRGIITNIRSFDNMIGKGFREETLHTFLAPPGVGKTAGMAAFATEFLKQKLDVVIFTLEMNESEWMKRIYSNLLDIDISTIESLDPLVMKNKFKEIEESLGTLVVKEYPSYVLNSLDIQNFLEKYEQQTGIKNPLVFVDYLGLMTSFRLRAGNVNSYEFVKSITAELRGVAQKRGITIFTAHQLNRSAIGNLEAGQEAVSDSAGISMFSDSMIFFLQTKEMKENGEINVNFEKNRMTGKTFSFKIGFDYNKMRFEDKFLEDSLIEESPNSIEKELGNDIMSDLFS